MECGIPGKVSVSKEKLKYSTILLHEFTDFREAIVRIVAKLKESDLHCLIVFVLLTVLQIWI